MPFATIIFQGRYTISGANIKFATTGRSLGGYRIDFEGELQAEGLRVTSTSQIGNTPSTDDYKFIKVDF